MKYHKIAVIIAGIDQSYQAAILKGIASSAVKCNMHISVFVSFSGTMGDSKQQSDDFNTLSGTMSNPKHDTGEFNIFNLPDLSFFDGAILLTNTIGYQPVINDILEKIKAADIPAVSIDYDIPYLYHIGIDNKIAMRRITEHLIDVHKFSRFKYISGPKDNPESADRLSAFLEVLREHDITIDDDSLFYGDFRAPSGKAAIDYFLTQDEKLPDAIICANDVMAASAINKLVEFGYSVPKDIAVTGFDNTYSHHNYQVELTSVDRPLVFSGQLACEMLDNHFNELTFNRSIVLSAGAHFTESCGCMENAHLDISEFRSLNYRNYMKYEHSMSFMSSINRLNCSLLSCNTLEAYVDTLKSFVAEMDPEEFYLCLCDNWDSESAIDDNSRGISESDDIQTDYTDRFIVAVAYKRGKFYDDTKIVSKKNLLPETDGSIETGLYYYIPMHFGKRCLGYMCIHNSPLPLNNSMFETLCISLSNSIENLRKVVCLEFAVSKLRILYTMDTFCDIYNRNGFVQASGAIYEDCVKNKKNIMLMFIDLDGLKGINDTYGHDVGDCAICNIADILRDSCTNGEVFCRFGGDEFIVFASESTDEDAERLTAKIQANVKAINDRKCNPYELSASTGYVISVPNPGDDIFRFVTEADKKMYVEKRKKKRSKYLKT